MGTSSRVRKTSQFLSVGVFGWGRWGGGGAKGNTVAAGGQRGWHSRVVVWVGGVGAAGRGGQDVWCAGRLWKCEAVGGGGGGDCCRIR